VLAAALNAPAVPGMRLCRVHALGERLPSDVDAALHYAMRPWRRSLLG
jgi:hypothetical protein